MSAWRAWTASVAGEEITVVQTQDRSQMPDLAPHPCTTILQPAVPPQNSAGPAYHTESAVNPVDVPPYGLHML